MRKSFTSDGVQWAWDATSITAASTCLKLYEYTIIQGWQPLGPQPKDLRFGGHFASAVEQYYKLTLKEKLSHDEALLTVVRTALVETWDHLLDENGERIPDSGRAWDSHDPVKNRWNLIRTIIWYFAHYVEDKLDTTSVVTLNNGKPAVELSFEVPIASDIVYCGHFDRMATRDGSDLFVMDQKTTGGTLNKFYYESFNLSIQMTGYSFAGNVLFGAPIRGVMIDAASVQVGGTSFGRGETFRSEEQINEWLKETEIVIKRAQDAAASGFFPRNTTACGHYRGCAFKEICSLSPSNRERFLRGQFAQTKRWDPIERR